MPRRFHKPPLEDEWRRNIPTADDTRPHRSATPQRKCECRNHTGNPKSSYKTADAAMGWAVTRIGAFNGTWRAYQCPTSDRWHLTTRKEWK